MKREKLSYKEKEKLPQKEGYFITNYGDYMPCIRIPTKIKLNREQRIKAREERIKSNKSRS